MAMAQKDDEIAYLKSEIERLELLLKQKSDALSKVVLLVVFDWLDHLCAGSACLRAAHCPQRSACDGGVVSLLSFFISFFLFRFPQTFVH